MTRRISCLLAAALVVTASSAFAETTHPYAGITLIRRTEPNPRGGSVTMHVALVDPLTPGISFAVTDHDGSRETRRQTTVDFVQEQHAALGINVAFFNPVVPASQVARDPDVFLAGLIASRGHVVSDFDPQPADPLGTVQNYAIVPFAPALNIDPANRVSILHYDSTQSVPHSHEPATLWNTLSGSAQIITHGQLSVPMYRDATHPDGQLTPRPGNPPYDNTHSWYDISNARTAIGFTRDGRTLVLFAADKITDTGGLTVGEVARILRDDYRCYEALNLDGGGSTAMALRDPATGEVRLLNISADPTAPQGRAAGANLAVFAGPVLPEGQWLLWLLAGGALLVAGYGRRD